MTRGAEPDRPGRTGGPYRRRVVAVMLVVGMALLAQACAGSSDSDGGDGGDGPDCGEAVARAGGGHWTCTFADDFRGDRLDPGKWLIQSTALTGFRNNQECYGNDDNVVVSRGVRRLTVRREAAPFTSEDPAGHFVTQYTGGMVSTWERFSQAYGRFEIRARMPDVKVPGIHSALWLWPQDPAKRGGKPTSGEIDIGEYYSVHPDRVIPYVHYTPAAADPGVTNNYCLVADPAAWHDYLLEWTSQTLTIAYDGKTCLVSNWNPAPPLIKPAPLDQPFIIALTQSLGVATTANQFDAATLLPATMQVDRVRVWK